MAQTATKTGWDDDRVDEMVEAILGAARTVDRLSEQALRETGAGVTAAQLRMLAVLAERGPSSVAALAGQLDVNRSTALRMVERLVALGMVSREDNPRNGREVVVKPTRAGSALLKKVATRRRRAVGSLLHSLPAELDRKHVHALTAVANGA